jgi:tetratricopeptide (TPR) repeat protein
VTAQKHLTRHDMKQDELVSWMTRAIIWAEQNTSRLLAGVGALVALLLVIMGIYMWAGSRTRDAYGMLAGVQKIVRTPLASEADAGSDSFATQRERAQRTVDAADGLLEAHSSGDAANWARYYRAVALLDLGRSEDAVAAATAVIEATRGDEMLGGLARMVAGQAEEARSNLPAAVEQYAAAAEHDGSAFPPELAMLNQARCLDSMGRPQDAIAVYQKVLDLHGNSPLAERASRSLESLRGAVAP